MKNQIIKSEKLSEHEIIHGNSTKFFGNMSISKDMDGKTDENRRKFWNKLGLNYKKSQIIFPELKQSANVALISGKQTGAITLLKQNSPEIIKLKKFPGINPPADYITNPETGIDACISNSKNLFIAILPADCAPVFLFDPLTNYYALIHAGVLGAFSNIVANTISCMKDWCATDPQNLICYIGPAISAKAYNLKKSGLWDKTLKNKIEEKTADNFDLKLFLKGQLINAGLKDKNIEISSLCTATNQDQFFSNHSAKLIAEKQIQGRHMSIIGRN